ncbi:MAG: tetratricopeptide repeat protein [Xenococcus sp. (in: cyanobacteria)]
MTTFQEEAIGHKPQSAEDHVNLGLTFSKQGKLEEAIASYQAAIRLKPDLAEAHNNLGIALQELGRGEEAIASYKKALSLKPELAEVHNNLGVLLQEQGQLEKAIASYQTAIRLKPNYHTAKFSLVIAQLPVIHSSDQEIQLRRNNYRQELQNLANSYEQASPEERAEAAAAVGSNQPFHLAYQGLNDRDLQQTYGSMIHQLMTSRYPQWNQPRSLPKLAAKQKIRIGFVSGFFNHHSVWKIPLQGWVENLDRSEFELFGYYTGSKRDQETIRAAKAFDQFEHDSFSVAQWAEKIVQDELHVLIFPEFGMDPMTVQLGCLRLAPVQLVFGGHPETSGLPTIDYHLSSDLMEPPNGQEHYTEQLIRLPNMAVCYKLISIQPEATSKQDIGIQDQDIMFWCCQSLFKYLPKHDDVFPRIAQKLVNAKFVFIKHGSEFATNIFCQRLERAFREFDLDYQDYCIFLPRLTGNQFNGTTAIADVFLDNIGWAGNNTTMESTAYNLPIVTLPGELMRGRHTMAILKMMGVTETIAKDKEEYIDIAVRLGQDADYRHKISQQIAQNKHKLYDDLSPVRALEDFIFKVVNKPRKFDNAKVTETFKLAVQYHRAKRVNEAKQAYLKVLELQSEHPESLYGLGSIAQESGDLEEAEQYLNVAVKTQPKFLQAWFSLGNLRQSQGQFSAAEQAYQVALKLRPDSAPICNNLGYVLQQQDRWEAAASYYKKALELQPDCVEADVNWGNALFTQGKLAPEQISHYAELNHKLGLGRHRVGDWSTAIIYYRQAITMEPDLVDAHYHLALALQQQRKLTEATSCYQEVLRLKPEYGTAYYNLGKIYQDQGDLSQATANFRQGLELMNSDYAQAVASHQHDPTFAENFTTPQTPQGEVVIAGHKFPAIPALSESETKRPFWSVVIPVVNRPEYFPECLASVLSQWTNDEEMEIIVLDNGSEPAQWKIPNDLGKGIIRYYRFPETVPLQENWNTAVSLCRGQWIHLLHHDDYILPGFYERLKAGLETCPESVGAAFTGYENINEDRKVIFYQQHNLENYRGVVLDWVTRIGVSCPLSPPSVVIRRIAYEKLGGYKLDLPYTCDWEFYKRVASFYDWFYEPGIFAHYREHANSVTIAENMSGASGAAHRRAIEISESYLPAEKRAEITAKSRAYHFSWCLGRANIPLQVGNLDGVLSLIQEALKMDNSPEAIASLSQWLQQEQAAALVKHIAVLEIDSAEAEQNILVNLARSIFYNESPLR